MPNVPFWNWNKICPIWNNDYFKRLIWSKVCAKCSIKTNILCSLELRLCLCRIYNKCFVKGANLNKICAKCAIWNKICRNSLFHMSIGLCNIQQNVSPIFYYPYLKVLNLKTPYFELLQQGPI